MTRASLTTKRMHRKRVRHGITALVLTSMAAMFAATPAYAVTIRENIVVSGPTIRLGDLFTDIGDKAEDTVLDAPAPGRTINLTQFDLIRIIKDNNIDWTLPSHIRRVTIRRDGIPVEERDLEMLIADLAVSEGAAPSLNVRLFGRFDNLYLPYGATLSDIEIDRFSLSSRRDRFSAVLRFPTGKSTQDISITGRLEEMHSIPVLARQIRPGDIVRQDDITWMDIPVQRVNARVIQTTNQIVGMTLRRPLRTGQPLMTTDLTRPLAVEKGHAVSITYSAGALKLAAAGRAMQDGAKGDTIRVMNSASNQALDARVISTNQVEVISIRSLLTANR